MGPVYLKETAGGSSCQVLVGRNRASVFAGRKCGWANRSATLWAYCRQSGS